MNDSSFILNSLTRLFIFSGLNLVTVMKDSYFIVNSLTRLQSLFLGFS